MVDCITFYSAWLRFGSARSGFGFDSGIGIVIGLVVKEKKLTSERITGNGRIFLNKAS